MNDIYDQHRTAFKNISAYVIVKDNERIGTVTIKHGNSRLTAYVHEYGNEMVRGTASGYGYDKASAAIASATRHCLDSPLQRARGAPSLSVERGAIYAGV